MSSAFARNVFGLTGPAGLASWGVAGVGAYFFFYLPEQRREQAELEKRETAARLMRGYHATWNFFGGLPELFAPQYRGSGSGGLVWERRRNGAGLPREPLPSKVDIFKLSRVAAGVGAMADRGRRCRRQVVVAREERTRH